MQKEILQTFTTPQPQKFEPGSTAEEKLDFARVFLRDRNNMATMKSKAEAAGTTSQKVRTNSCALADAAVQGACALQNGLFATVGALQRTGSGLSKLLCVRRGFDETPSCLKVEELKLAEGEEEDEDEERTAVSPEIEAGSE